MRDSLATHCPQVTCKVENTSDDEVTPDSPMSTTSTSSRWVHALRFRLQATPASFCLLRLAPPDSCLHIGLAVFPAELLAVHAQETRGSVEPQGYLSGQACRHQFSAGCKLLLTLHLIACSRKVGAHIKSAVGTAAEKCAEKCALAFTQALVLQSAVYRHASGTPVVARTAASCSPHIKVMRSPLQ
jgi:hypothetical protein